jgi:hypothetical protein
MGMELSVAGEAKIRISPFKCATVAHPTDSVALQGFENNRAHGIARLELRILGAIRSSLLSLPEMFQVPLDRKTLN